MNIKQTWEKFNWWFDHTGHWMTSPNEEGRQKMILIWKKHGINSLPDYIGEEQ